MQPEYPCQNHQTLFLMIISCLFCLLVAMATESLNCSLILIAYEVCVPREAHGSLALYLPSCSLDSFHNLL